MSYTTVYYISSIPVETLSGVVIEYKITYDLSGVQQNYYTSGFNPPDNHSYPLIPSCVVNGFEHTATILEKNQIV